MDENDINNLPIIEKRRLSKSGASIVLSLPPKWIREHGLSEGMEVIVVANGELKLFPVNKESVAKINKQVAEVRQNFKDYVHEDPLGSDTKGSTT